MALMQTLVTDSGLAVATVAACAAVGAYAHRSGIFTEEAQRAVDKLISSIFLPCLIFSKILPNMNVQALLDIWPLAFFCLITVLTGLMMGAVAGRGVPKFKGMLMVAIAFPNSFAVPLTLMLALGDHPKLLANGQASGEPLRARINMLFLLSYSLWVLARWGIGYPLLSGAVSCAEWRKKVLNPPVVACLVAMATGLLVSLLPPAWCAAIGAASVLQPLSTALAYSGRCTVPCVLLVLGARVNDAISKLWAAAKSPSKLAEPLVEELSDGDCSADSASEGLPVSAYLSVLLARQFVSPCLSAAFAFGVLRPFLGVADPVILLVALLQTAGPPMINLSVMAGLSGSNELQVANLLLLTYACSVVTWTISVFFFLYLL